MTLQPPPPPWELPALPEPLATSLQEQITILHARYDVLRGAVMTNSDRFADFQRSLDELRRQLNERPCSLCRGEGCESPTCGRAAPPPAAP